jgi:hypothetical protein
MALWQVAARVIEVTGLDRMGYPCSTLHANARATRSSAAMMGGVEEIEVVVAHRERATLRVGDVFLKIDAIRLAPIARSRRWR